MLPMSYIYIIYCVGTSRYYYNLSENIVLILFQKS